MSKPEKNLLQYELTGSRIQDTMESWAEEFFNQVVDYAAKVNAEKSKKEDSLNNGKKEE